MNSTIKVSGQILSELSEKIPNNIIALNELIKNSYDAGASEVIIDVNIKQSKLTIIDNGIGMDKEDIDTLFHISNSKKIYGQLKKINGFERYTQGSKGLGFLSVFKFGSNVSWITKQNKILNFSIDFNDLSSVDDISEYIVEINEDDRIFEYETGTKIEILLVGYAQKSLIDYFSDSKNYLKIVNSFIDDEFTIKLKIDDEEYCTEKKLKINEQDIQYKLFHITYDSTSKKVIYKYNEHEIDSFLFPFDDDRYSLDLDIMILFLPSKGKEKITRLFYNPLNEDLTPLVYINSNLFNNYTLFDPDVRKNKKTTEKLNQMIGYIKIYSSNSDMNFNSDRTQFIQNDLTDTITNFLRELNIKIQITGSKYKSSLGQFEFIKNKHIYKSKTHNIIDLKENIKDDFPFKDKIEISVVGNTINYNLFDKSISATIIDDESGSTPNPKQKAIINLTKLTDTINIDSGQIDLSDYIESCTDSDGNLVDKSNIRYYINETILNSSILENQRKESIIEIKYVYTDTDTGETVQTLTLSIKKKQSPITTSRDSNVLISIPGSNDYKISYCGTVSKLINQINKLDIDGNLEIIACSLRTMIELSKEKIRQCNKMSSLFTSKEELSVFVEKLVEYVVADSSLLTEIDNNTKIGYRSLTNKLIPSHFANVVKNSHLATHSATNYLTKNDIVEIADKVSFIIVITNEVILNPNVK